MCKIERKQEAAVRCRELSSVFRDDVKGWEGQRVRGRPKGAGGVRKHIADLLHCTAELMQHFKAITPI